MNNNLKKWLFALLLSIPIFFLYAIHFFNHDKALKPTGFIQWEHALYMIAAKTYQSGDATILYRYPLADDPNSPKVFFQPQTFILGYLWKLIPISPGLLLSCFGLLFTLLTIRTLIEIVATISPEIKYPKIIAVLFTWGGGILSLCGLLLHFTYFKGSGNLSDHVLALDPGKGWWCLNFGRSLIYPFEAYYHFLFMLTILLVLRKQFLYAALVMIVLSISHPYTSTELTAIIFSWMIIEYFYLKSNEINKKGLCYLSGAIVFQVFYYGILLKILPVYSTLSQQSTLDWGYKIWHFLPAYLLVWLLSFFAIKNVSLLQKQFSSSINRLFFCWGLIAFLLTVHGFAIKPVQPLHFTRGYVYAGFFLFCIPAITHLLELIKKKSKTSFRVILFIGCLVFLSDNISWFYFHTSKNNTGTYLTKNEMGLINFFKEKKDHGWIIAAENNVELSTNIQLYTTYSAWIPHPYLTFNLESKRVALQKLIASGEIDARWKNTPAYFFIENKDAGLIKQPFNFPIKFENKTYKVFQIN